MLAAPPGGAAKVVRCGSCQRTFPLSSALVKTEDLVASWLFEEERDEGGPAAGQEIAAPEAAASKAVAPKPAERPSTQRPEPEPEPQPPEKKQIRVVKIARDGVLFEFPAGRLNELGFRCAMPKRCLQCAARSHLKAHVVIFAAGLVDSVSLEAEHSAGALVLSDAEVRGLSCRELLKRLPNVPNVPPPGHQPMPYWVCDMCSGSGTIRGQIQVNATTGVGRCRLLVSNLRRAEEFLVSAGGEDSEAHESLKERIAQIAENPWDMLPEVVQHRVDQWFRPAEGESFYAYVPDQDYARTEDGMSGLLISSHRMIYHTPMRHREIGGSEPLEMELSQSGSRGNLQMKTTTWELRHFALDRPGIANLRRGLTLAKFQVAWR